MLNEINLSRADLNLLVLFEAIIAERHVGRAAERMNLTPSAVSHGLARLRRLLNDPLFLKTPKGVVPTARAVDLAPAIADILAGVRNVISVAEPFDPATSTRRFIIGGPDAVSAVFLPSFLRDVSKLAPYIDIGIRQLLPPQGGRLQGAWEPVLAELESRTIDIAVIPFSGVAARFVEQTLYEEDFVIAMRAGHSFAKAPSLDRYCEMRHLLVSLTADPNGMFDEALARQGRSRRIALTVPNFMQAIAILAETDMLAALPRSLVAAHAARFGLTSVELPVPLKPDKISAIATKAAMMDPGVDWLMRALLSARPGTYPAQTTQRARPGRRRARAGRWSSHQI
jgi:DNA-binding transcriptional LysR family regulator